MMPAIADPFRARASLQTPDGQTLTYFKLAAVESLVPLGLDKLPYTVKILLEKDLDGHR